MKLTIFQSDKGDCTLLEAASGELMLCDGGMGPSMRDHVRHALGQLRDDQRDLEFIYVSHIDNDHISGVLQLLQDEVEWRVFDHHEQTENPINPPKVPRPPVIKGILHNGFRDLITVNDADQPVGNMSGGERQSLAIARAIQRGARILILDEPTAALGVKQADIVLDNVVKAKARGIGVVLVTHNPQHAYQVGDVFVVLRQGRVVAGVQRNDVDPQTLGRLMSGTDG